MTPVLRATQFRRVSFRATGGKAKAIFWHLGVRAALEDRGFTFASGFGRERAEPEPGQITTLIGSSAGAVFAILVAAGFDIPTIVNSFIGRKSPLPPIDDDVVFVKHHAGLRGYFRRIRNAVNLRAGAEMFPGSGVGPNGSNNGDEEAEIHADYRLTLQKFRQHFRWSDLLVLRSRYVLSGMESWFRAILGPHDSFDDIRTSLYILASDLDAPMTAAFGAQEKNCGWYEYFRGVQPSRAASASMAIPSVYNPVAIEVSGRKHYFIDGDVYNPTEPMIESDRKCDLAIISSFESPYRFHPAIGSLHHLGLPYEVSQAIALTIYNRFMQARKSASAKWAALEAARDALAKHVDEETLERECRRIAEAMDMSLDMKIVHIHPYKNPLLFFENPFDLSSRTLGKMIVEASLQASDLLDRAGFTTP